MKITCKNQEFSIRGKKFCFFISSTSIGFNYWYFGLPWYGNKRDIKLRLAFIPDDLEFWNHFLWVIPNPVFVEKIMPKYLVIVRYGTNYYAMERIPF